MAISRSDGAIIFGSANDSTTGDVYIQAASFASDGTTGADAIISEVVDGSTGNMISFKQGECQSLYFPKGLRIRNPKLTTLDGGTVTLFLR